MAQNRDYSPYQQKVIRDFYKNREGIQGQALADLVSDLYLATTEAKKTSLWKKAESLMTGLHVPPAAVAAIVSKRDLAAIADVAAKGFAIDKKSEWAKDAREDRRG